MAKFLCMAIIDEEEVTSPVSAFDYIMDNPAELDIEEYDDDEEIHVDISTKRV